MDETPMRFELLSSRTLEFSDSRTVPVKSCGAEKRSFTVTLAVAADGKKLPPSVIFKGVHTPRDLAVPDTVRVLFHKKGWMDEKGNVDNRSAYSRINIEFQILLSTRKFFLAKILGYKLNPYLGENLPVLSLICWKNRSAYRRINTVCCPLHVNGITSHASCSLEHLGN